jgi:sigma-B regulation protein RsbU (phosphoserine phosphatase)
MLSILLIEDDEVDRMRVRRFLKEGPVAWARVDEAETLDKGRAKLANNMYDCVLLDLHLPDGNGMDFLRSLKESTAEFPAIVLQTVEDDEVLGMAALELGAQDYLVKGNLNAALLLKAVRYAIQRQGMLREKDRLVNELRDALRNVQILQGLLPICSACKRIRNDNGYWQQVEEYFTRHSNAKFSHGICPECVKTIYPDIG